MCGGQAVPHRKQLRRETSDDAILGRLVMNELMSPNGRMAPILTREQLVKTISQRCSLNRESGLLASNQSTKGRPAHDCLRVWLRRRNGSKTRQQTSLCQEKRAARASAPKGLWASIVSAVLFLIARKRCQELGKGWCRAGSNHSRTVCAKADQESFVDSLAVSTGGLAIKGESFTCETLLLLKSPWFA